MLRTRVVLVDDLSLFREGFRSLLSSGEEFEVVGESEGAPAVYALVDELEPDLMVVSPHLAGVPGVAVVRELVRRQPRRRVLMLGVRKDDDAIRQALSAGASGYALKHQPAKEVLDGLRAVARGQTYLAPGIAAVVVDDALRLRRGQSADPGPCDVLSVREREVFDLLVRGHSTQEVARLLCISTKTVETHRARVFQKIGVHSLVDLVRFAARNQLPLD